MESAEDFLQNSIPSFLYSLELWLETGTTVDVGSSIVNQIPVLKAELEQHVENFCRVYENKYETEVLQTFEHETGNFEDEAEETYKDWSDWAVPSLRAFCRQDGKYSTPKHTADWNAQLAEPVPDALNGAWRRLRSKTFEVVDALIGALEGSLNGYIKAAEGKECLQLSIAALTCLDAYRPKRFIENLRHTKNTLAHRVQSLVDPFKRDLDNCMKRSMGNNEVSYVGTYMHTRYQDCLDISGKGAKLRMLGVLNTGIRGLYQAIHEELAKDFQKLKEDLRASALERIHEVTNAIESDIRNMSQAREELQLLLKHPDLIDDLRRALDRANKDYIQIDEYAKGPREAFRNQTWR